MLRMSSMRAPCGGHELQFRRRLRQVRSRLARRGDFDPAMHALFTFLHDREVERLAGLEIAGDEASENELVVPGVGQIPARPAKSPPRPR